MKKNYLVTSIVVSILVVAVMAGAGYFLLGHGTEPVTKSKVEANLLAEENNQNKVTADWNIAQGEAVSGENVAHDQDSPELPIAAVEENRDDNSENVNPQNEQPVVAVKVPVGDQEVQSSAVPGPVATTQPLEALTEQPAVSPLNNESAPRQEAIVQQTASLVPVTYSFGATSNYTFRMEVKVTNNGSDISQNVSVAVPLLENSSPYQTTSLKSVNNDIQSSSGRVSTFSIGDLAPGETKAIVADFTISARTMSINSSNEAVATAKKIYEQYAGPGNCRDLALAFISKSREQGLTAREVIGFARPQRGVMTAGSLQGARHSWAEFYVDGLGWVPVDLTFQYFGNFPQTSHIVESYSDQSIKVNFTGGSLSASWSNNVL